MSETQPDLREARARAIHREADDGSVWALMPDEHRECWRQSADRIRAQFLAPILAQVSALQAEVEAARALNRDLHRRTQKAESFRARHGNTYGVKARWAGRQALRKALAEVERLQKVEGEREGDLRAAEARGAEIMRHAAVMACLDLNDAYRETSEHQIAQRNTAKAAEAIAWADGAMLCAHAIRDLKPALHGRPSLAETKEGSDAR